MSTARSLFSALGAGVAFTMGAGGEKLGFAPQPGSSLTKTFSITGEYSLEDFSLMVNGADIKAMLPPVEMSLEQSSKVEVTDTYKAVADGRPTELLRTFDELSGMMTMEISPAEGDIPEIASTSALEGKTVAFRWNPEKQEHEASFPEGDGDENLLEGLEEDMDLRRFLPQTEVAEGESWTVPLAELQCLVMPGGNLQMVPADLDVDEDSMKQFQELFGGFGEELGDLLEGECKCTFKGMQEEDGARLAEIGIELQVATNIDLTEMLDKVIRKAIEEQGVGESIELSLDTADLNLDYEGTGTLLWNLAAGRAHSFQLGGDVTIDMDLAVGVVAEGESQDLDASVEMSGTMAQELVTRE